MRKRKPPVTPEQFAYLERVAALGCIVCRNERLRQGWMSCGAEIHHIRAGMGLGQRNDYRHTLPLCAKHHRSGPHGVAFHAGRKTWEANFGTERRLLRQVRRLLGYKGMPG